MDVSIFVSCQVLVVQLCIDQTGRKIRTPDIFGNTSFLPNPWITRVKFQSGG